MNPPYSLRGVYSAQWIPVDSNGRVDRPNLAAHLHFERSQGINGVLALGSTGQFPHFSRYERQDALATIAELAGTLPVIANVTDIRPKVAVELGRFAKQLGLPAIAIMPPPFFPLSQSDMLAHFLHIAEAVDLPVMLYNFPELTGKKIELQTVAAFARRAAMCGIKQSGGELAYHEPLIQLGRELNFAVMSGADTRLPHVFELGASGCIGGLVNIVPELMVRLYQICVEGASGEKTEIAAQMTEVGRIVDQLTFPLNIAAALEARGFEPGAAKAIVSKESANLCAIIVADLRRRFGEWNLAAARLDRSAVSMETLA